MDPTLDDFITSDWLKRARAELARRDPLDALRDVEDLLQWAAQRADDAIDLACIDTVLAGRLDEELDRLLAQRQPRKPSSLNATCVDAYWCGSFVMMLRLATITYPSPRSRNGKGPVSTFSRWDNACLQPPRRDHHAWIERLYWENRNFAAEQTNVVRHPTLNR